VNWCAGCALAAACAFGASAQNVAPTVAITAPAAGASFVGPAAISLSATAADSDGTISKVSYYNGATLLGAPTVAPYIYNWTNIAVGSYVITAKATDSKGGVQTSAPINVTVKANASNNRVRSAIRTRPQP
jgi:chitinase